MMKEKSSWEKYAEKFLEKKGFTVKLVKQYNSKTVYDVSRNGLSERLEIPCAIVDKKKYMDSVLNGFEMKEEIERLKSTL